MRTVEEITTMSPEELEALHKKIKRTVIIHVTVKIGVAVASVVVSRIIGNMIDARMNADKTEEETN